MAFVEYSEYDGYTIIVPKQFPPDDSKLLMQLQVLAIDAHAVSRAIFRFNVVSLFRRLTVDKAAIEKAIEQSLRLLLQQGNQMWCPPFMLKV